MKKKSCLFRFINLFKCPQKRKFVEESDEEAEFQRALSQPLSEMPTILKNTFTTPDSSKNERLESLINSALSSNDMRRTVSNFLDASY